MVKKLVSVPLGVKIISVLIYIYAGLLIIGGIFFLVGASFFIDLGFDKIPLISTLGAGAFFVIALMLIVLGIIGFFIGRALWKAQNWARIVVIIYSILFILGNFIRMIVVGSMLDSLINIIINSVIAGYLLFSKEVKEVF